jgi:hypothetical protein
VVSWELSFLKVYSMMKIFIFIWPFSAKNLWPHPCYSLQRELHDFTLSPLYLNIETEALEKPQHLPLCLRQKKWASKSGAFLLHSLERWFTEGLDLKNSVTLISIIIKNNFPFEINKKFIINRKLLNIL